MKSRLRLDFLLVACGGLFLLLIAYERTAVVEQRRPSVYSSYDRGPNGYAALYEVLRAAGVPVRRFERVLAVLDSGVKTLVITSYENDPNRKPLDQHDAAALRDFVAKGGRLVAVDSDFAGKLDVAPAVGTTLQTPGGGDAIAIARNAYTENVRRVRGTIDWTFSFKEPLGVPLLANRNGMVAVWYRYGHGEIIAITAPALLGNAQLANADNVGFAYNAIAGHGPVVFDEYVHGYSDNLSIWGALPVPVRAAVWIVLAIVIIALIGANVPFAPPFRLDASDERDSSDYIAAIAELMRRSRRRPRDNDVLRQARIDFHGRKEHA